MRTKRQDLVARVASLPDDLLDDVQQSLDDIVRWHQAGVYRLSDDERAGVRKGMDAAKRGEFVSDEEMMAFRASLIIPATC